MNWPVVALILVLAGFASGSWFGHDYATKQYAERELERKQAWGEALDATAKELSKIKITQRNITNQAETVIKREVVYADCKNTPEMLGIVNQAAKGGVK